LIEILAVILDDEAVILDDELVVMVNYLEDDCHEEEIIYQIYHQ
jgi:hypothetical protein